MSTFSHGTHLTGLQPLACHFPMVTSFLRLFLSLFTPGSERPTEAKAGNGGSQITHEDKMAVLAALDMLEAKVVRTGQILTADEIDIYENALRVIGPID